MWRLNNAIGQRGRLQNQRIHQVQNPAAVPGPAAANLHVRAPLVFGGPAYVPNVNPVQIPILLPAGPPPGAVQGVRVNTLGILSDDLIIFVDKVSHKPAFNPTTISQFFELSKMVRAGPERISKRDYFSAVDMVNRDILSSHREIHATNRGPLHDGRYSELCRLNMENRLSFQRNEIILPLIFSCDGFNFSGSHKGCSWPFMAQFLSIPNGQRQKYENMLLLYLYSAGRDPPKFMLKRISRELSAFAASINRNPMVVDSSLGPVTVRIRFVGCSMDLKAHAHVFNTNGWHGWFGCPWCLLRGQRIGGTMRWSVVQPANRRTEDRHVPGGVIYDQSLQAVDSLPFFDYTFGPGVGPILSTGSLSFKKDVDLTSLVHVIRDNLKCSKERLGLKAPTNRSLWRYLVQGLVYATLRDNSTFTKLCYRPSYATGTGTSDCTNVASVSDWQSTCQIINLLVKLLGKWDSHERSDYVVIAGNTFSDAIKEARRETSDSLKKRKGTAGKPLEFFDRLISSND